MWWATYHDFEGVMNGADKRVFTAGEGGTHHAMQAMAKNIAGGLGGGQGHTLILNPHHSHTSFPGRYQHAVLADGTALPTHINRAAEDALLLDLRVLDSDSSVEGFHKHQRKIVRDSGCYGPEHGPLKLLKHGQHWNHRTDVLNKATIKSP